jgi:hypothetical protein
MSVTSKSSSNKAHVRPLRECFSIVEHILILIMYFQIIFKEYICQIHLIGHICLSIMPIQDIFIPMFVFYDDSKCNNALILDFFCWIGIKVKNL